MPFFHRHKKDAGAAANAASTTKASPQTQATSVGNGKLRVQLTQHDNVFSPGSSLQGIICFSDNALSDAQSVYVEMEGSASYLVQGRIRPSIGGKSELVGGLDAHSGVVANFREKHRFFHIKQLIWQAGQAAGSTDSLSFALDIPRDRTCKCVGADILLPPTVDEKRGFKERERDQSLIDIQYKLVATMERDGVLKRNMKYAIGRFCHFDCLTY